MFQEPTLNSVDLETLIKMVGRDGEAPSTADERIDFIRELTLKSLRVKPDKWDRMYISDEQRHFIHSFVEGNKPIVNRLENTLFFSPREFYFNEE